MSRAIITPATSPLRGTLKLPGDKSISHRRALLSLFVKDDVWLSNYATGEDCLATLNCLERLGKQVLRNGTDVVIAGDVNANSAEFDCSNSGTTARLLMGILAAQRGWWVLRGDSSLSRRPMERVAAPLRQMGGRIELTDGCLPARIEGRGLHGIEYVSPVASAQVKSAVLFAGLKAEGITRYREPMPTRDHTERILKLAPDAEGWIALDPRATKVNAGALSAKIPCDPSAAAFWVVAALMVAESRLTLPEVLVNPCRIAYVDVLRAAGADLSLADARTEREEDTATLSVSSSSLRSFMVRSAAAASVMDEIPALAVLATMCDGTTEFRDVGELRVKESDRLRLITENLRSMGARVQVRDDGISVEGVSELHGAEITTDGDHRIALAFAVAGLSAQGQTQIHDAECVRVSYPAFWDDLERLAPGLAIFEN